MKKLLIAAVMMILFALVGCGKEVATEDQGVALAPSMRVVGARSDNGYTYIVDDNTGTVYILSDVCPRYGITIAYKDGKVMTIEDLEKLSESAAVKSEE